MERNITNTDKQLATADKLEFNSRLLRRHQLHFWIGDREYQFLRSMAEIEGETLSTLLRSIIRNLMRPNGHR